jgi:FG-GAP repeat
VCVRECVDEAVYLGTYAVFSVCDVNRIEDDPVADFSSHVCGVVGCAPFSLIGVDACILVSDPAFQNDQGRVSVYRRVDAAWLLEVVLEDIEGRSGDMYGSAVSLSGERLLIGAPGSCKWVSM